MRVALTRNPSPASLASHVHTMVSMLENCRVNGHEAEINWRNYPAALYRPSVGGLIPHWNQWELYFVSSNQGTPPNSPVWVWDSLSWRHHCPIVGDLPFNAETQEQIRLLRRIVPRHLLLNQAVLNHAAALQTSNTINPATTVCISHRGTDKGVESPIPPIEDFYNIVDRYSSYDLWIQAEEEATYAKFLARYPNAKRVREFHAAPSGPLFADYTNPKSGYEKGLDAMAMMVMMSRCAVLIKNASNLADLAAGLGTGDVYHIRGKAAYLPRHPHHILTNQGAYAWAS